MAVISVTEKIATKKWQMRSDHLSNSMKCQTYALQVRHISIWRCNGNMRVLSVIFHSVEARIVNTDDKKKP